jgi:hypothetical protein
VVVKKGETNNIFPIRKEKKLEKSLFILKHLNISSIILLWYFRKPPSGLTKVFAGPRGGFF